MQRPKAHLLRKVDKGVLPDPRAIAMFDEKNNLLIVEGEWWDAQSAYVQNEVWRSAEPVMFRSDFEYGIPQYRPRKEFISYS